MQKENNILYSYIAGWVDGDGCIYVSKKYRHHSSLSLKLTDIEPIIFFKNNLNIKSNIIFKKASNQRFKEALAYEVKLSGVKCLSYLENIMPYLVEKQQKVVDFFELYPEKKLNKNITYLKHSEEEFYAWLSGYFEAEGHVGIKKKVAIKKLKSGKIQSYDYIESVLQLVNTNKFAMEFILNRLKQYNITNSLKKLNVLKGGVKKCNITKKIINRKPCYRLFFKGSDFLNVQEKILPHFVINRKKEKILEGIKNFKNSRYKRKGVKDYFNEKEKQNGERTLAR